MAELKVSSIFLPKKPRVLDSVQFKDNYGIATIEAHHITGDLNGSTASIKCSNNETAVNVKKIGEELEKLNTGYAPSKNYTIVKTSFIY